MTQDNSFKEAQKFGSWILILLLFSGLPLIIIFGFGIYQQIYKGEPFGNNPMSDNGLILTFASCMVTFFALILLFAKAKLYTEINLKGIRYKFVPFHLKFHEISWNDVENFEVKKYSPIRDYGGWGIRYRIGKRAYNVSGNQGLELQLKNGKKILFGTQKDNELKGFLENNIKK